MIRGFVAGNLIVGSVMAVTTTLMGAVFPLVSHAGIAPDERGP